MNCPLVSIVMATYNGERFLEAQMDSVLNQTYPAIEIIVVDDGSTDRTAEILQSYASKHNHIQLHFAKDKNLGYIKNFERGCRLVKGDYISFCDQDDVWHPDKTSALVKAIGNHSMAYSDAELVDAQLQSTGKLRSDIKNLRSYNNCLYFALDNCVGGHAMMIKKELFVAASPFPTEMPHDLWLAYASTLYNGLIYVPEALVKWRDHGSNVTVGTKPDSEKLIETCRRLQIFHDFCRPDMVLERKVLRQLLQSYQPYPITNNFLRMMLYFKYGNYLMAMKKRNKLRKFFFSIKMLFRRRLHVA